MLVGLDIDGIIRNFDGSLRKVYAKHYPDHVVPPTTKWGIENIYPIGKDIYKFAFVDHAVEVFGTAELYDNSLWFVEQLFKNYEVVCVTSQPSPIVMQTTFAWLEMNGFTEFIDHYMFVRSDKTFSKGRIRLDVLIDDCVENLKDAENYGVMGIGIERGWNKGLWDNLFKDYEEVLDFLYKIEKVKLGKIKMPELSLSV